jgi:hypothetical protein
MQKGSKYFGDELANQRWHTGRAITQNRHYWLTGKGVSSPIWGEPTWKPTYFAPLGAGLILPVSSFPLTFSEEGGLVGVLRTSYRDGVLAKIDSWSRVSAIFSLIPYFWFLSKWRHQKCHQKLFEEITLPITLLLAVFRLIHTKKASNKVI